MLYNINQRWFVLWFLCATINIDCANYSCFHGFVFCMAWKDETTYFSHLCIGKGCRDTHTKMNVFLTQMHAFRMCNLFKCKINEIKLQKGILIGWWWYKQMVCFCYLFLQRRGKNSILNSMHFDIVGYYLAWILIVLSPKWLSLKTLKWAVIHCLSIKP